MTTLTGTQVAQYAYAAGFRGTVLADFIAIAYAESRFDTKAYNGTLGTYGLWQIEASVHGFSSNPGTLYDPNVNAKEAYQLYKDHGLQPWAGDGYQNFMSIGNKYAATASPYVDENVLVNGQPYAAIANTSSSTTYLLWTVLDKFHIPNAYLGSGKFAVTLAGGHHITIQGVIYKGQTYIPWTDIPNISVTKSGGVFNFKSSYVALAVGAALVVGATFSAR